MGFSYFWKYLKVVFLFSGGAAPCTPAPAEGFFSCGGLFFLRKASSPFMTTKVGFYSFSWILTKLVEKCIILELVSIFSIQKSSRCFWDYSTFSLEKVTIAKGYFFSDNSHSPCKCNLNFWNLFWLFKAEQHLF